MTKQLNSSITLGNKKYSYLLKKIDSQKTFVKCEAAKIAQEFLNEDIANLLVDLPNLIFAEKKYQLEQDEVIRFRVSTQDKRSIEKKAAKLGFHSVSAFLRSLALGNHQSN